MLRFTSIGWMIPASSMSISSPWPMTFRPTFLPSLWSFLIYVMTLIGLRPAFSARVSGTTSNASAYALMQYWSAFSYVWLNLYSYCAISTSTLAPPGTRNGFLIRDLMLHSASWIERSASSMISLLAPLMTKQHVWLSLATSSFVRR